MPWDIGQVAPAFVKYFGDRGQETRDENVAVLGCGRGHDAFYLAKLGFNIYGFDFAENAINCCNQIKEKENLQNTNFIQVDFFQLIKNKKWKNYFDYVTEHTSLAAIDPKRRTDYIELIKHLLKSGGKLIGLFFIRPKELGGPPFGINVEEVRDLFKEDFIEIEELHYEECLHKGILEGYEYLGIFEKKAY